MTFQITLFSGCVYHKVYLKYTLSQSLLSVFHFKINVQLHKTSAKSSRIKPDYSLLD